MLPRNVAVIVLVSMLVLSPLPAVSSGQGDAGIGNNSFYMRMGQQSAPEYVVTFTETGLPSGSQWYVNITRGEYSGPIVSQNYSVNLPNGTYAYTSYSVYLRTEVNGSFVVDGTALHVIVTFSGAEYDITLLENGLPSGTEWSASLNGTTLYSITQTIIFREPNGNYTVYINQVQGFISSPADQTISVSGGNVNVNITFYELFNVTFYENGLPPGEPWYVNLTRWASSGEISGASYSFFIPNGSYSFTVYAPAGFSPSPSSGEVTVSGSPVEEEIVFTSTSPHSYGVTFVESGLPPGAAWYVNVSGLASSGPVTSYSYSLQLPNGSYTYAISTGDKEYAPSPYSGIFNVSGSPESIDVTFLPVVYDVVFSESSLPRGTYWYVNISNGQTFRSGTNVTSFSEPNGSYSFTISSGNRNYIPHPSNGSFDVSGAPVSERVNFAVIAHTVKFEESGLPSGTSWSVTLNGVQESSSTGAVSFTEPNGSYSFSVGYVSGFTASPSSGTVTVSGSNVSVLITFSQVAARTYSVTFKETGLPPGTSWSVTLNGMSNSSTGTTVSFTEPNGSYTYSIGEVQGFSSSPSSGTIEVDGSPVSQAVTFGQSVYGVTFNEKGLPPGSYWNVTLNGMERSSTSSSVSFSEPNGSYVFTVGIYRGYSSSPYSGAVTVDGSSISISVQFTQVKYSVTFTETGLPSGTQWQALLGNMSGSSNSSRITFHVANGTYAYSVPPIPGYVAGNGSGTLTVSGNNVTLHVEWKEEMYVIEIMEKGLPAGTKWSITLTGETFNGIEINATLSSENTSINFSEPNGSYLYTVHFPSGYLGSPQNGSLKLSGSPANELITFYRGGQYDSGYVILAAAVLTMIVAGAVVFYALRRKK